MRRYTIHILILSLVLVLASFIMLWTLPQCFLVIMPFVVLYFAAVTWLQHNIVVRAAHKDARRFVRVFLGITVGSLMLHLVVMTIYMFTHLKDAYLFAIAFGICYFSFLVFETAELVHFVRAYQQEHGTNPNASKQEENSNTEK